MIDYYRILGIPRNSDLSVIKQKYKEKALKYHPDRNKGDSKANKKFNLVKIAYDTLSDKEKRKYYDKNLNKSHKYSFSSSSFYSSNVNGKTHKKVRIQRNNDVYYKETRNGKVIKESGNLMIKDKK